MKTLFVLMLLTVLSGLNRQAIAQTLPVPVQKPKATQKTDPKTTPPDSSEPGSIVVSPAEQRMLVRREAALQKQFSDMQDYIEQLEKFIEDHNRQNHSCS